jgi:hypothetical protein
MSLSCLPDEKTFPVIFSFLEQMKWTCFGALVNQFFLLCFELFLFQASEKDKLSLVIPQKSAKPS